MRKREKIKALKEFHTKYYFDFGGGGSAGYTSPHINEYESGVYQGAKNMGGGNVSGAGMYNYAGVPQLAPVSNYGGGMPASKVGGAVGGTIKKSSSLPEPSFSGTRKVPSSQDPTAMQRGSQKPAFNVDPAFANLGAPLGGPAGIKVASAGYDFNPINQAIAGYQNPTKLNQTYQAASYNPYQFNFGQLPDEYTKQAYQSGASDINRQGANSLSALQEQVGTRRPGLLLNAGQSALRDTNKNLAGLNTQLNLNRINQNLDLARQQQAAQAGENMNAAQFNAGQQYQGYQSRADLERANEANRLANLAGLMGAGTSKINTQSGLLQNERDYQQQALQYLMDLYKTATGQAQQSAQLQNEQQKNTAGILGGLGGLASGAAKLAPLFF